MNLKPVIFLIVFSVAFSAKGQKDPSSIANAISLCKQNNLKEAIYELDNLLSSGYEFPSRILQQPALNKLRSDPDFRQELNRMMKRNVRESIITIIDDEEPGERLTIKGTIRAKDNTPIDNAVFYFYHTDAEGLYAPEHTRAGFGSNNPRLFGYVKSDSNGEFQVNTIKPASYPGIRNLRHIHFLIAKQGCSTNSQFYLDEDPEPTEVQIRNARARNFPILHVEKNHEGLLYVNFEWICR